ncbi:Bcl-2-modifying factor [Apodemus speciosus]|uniref:Bcl-2-modifying factor n=1 Tax=Apodemus speciosus TaxID=105296 RepID=A0ABQ0EI34_APOSI
MLEFAPSFLIECGRQALRVFVTLDPGAEPWHHDSEAETLSWSHPGEMEPPQCVEELEDDVFQPEDGEPGAQPGSLLSADLFAQSQLDCPLSRLQLFPLTHCCGPGLRPISQEDKATQTLSPASPSQGVMLPCGVTEEPQRLFYVHTGLWREGKGSEVILLCLREQTEEPLHLISEGAAHRALLEKQFWRESEKLDEACFGLEEGGGRRRQAPPAAVLVPALGNAGYRLPLPASFPAGSPLGEQPPEGQFLQHRAEVQIARKLQCIADQFHRLHTQQ